MLFKFNGKIYQRLKILNVKIKLKIHFNLNPESITYCARLLKNEDELNPSYPWYVVLPGNLISGPHSPYSSGWVKFIISDNGKCIAKNYLYENKITIDVCLSIPPEISALFNDLEPYY